MDITKTIEAATLDIHEGRHALLIRADFHPEDDGSSTATSSQPTSGLRFSSRRFRIFRAASAIRATFSPSATNPTCSQRLTFRACLLLQPRRVHRAGIRSHLRHFAAIRNRHRRV